MIDLKILAVADPAVDVYVDKKYNIIENFNQENVNVQFDIVSWEAYSAKLQQSFDGTLDYDIVMVAGHLWLNDFVNKDCLHNFEYDFSDIPTKVQEEMKCNGLTYLSPSFCDGHMIVYRKDIVGEEINEIVTVDEFIDIVRKLDDNGFKRPLAIKAHGSEIFLDALPYLRDGAENDIFYEKDGKVVCNFENMRLGLEKYLNLKQFAQEDSDRTGNQELIEIFKNNEAAIAVIWSGQLGILDKVYENSDNLGFATFDTAWNVTWSFAITNKCKNKEMAEKFLSYLREKDIDKLVGRHCGCPIRISSYNEDLEKFNWYELQLKMINEAKPIMKMVNSGAKIDALYSLIWKVFNEEITVDEAIFEMNKVSES